MTDLMRRTAHVRRLPGFAARVLLLAGVALSTIPATARAHDEGTLKLVSRTLGVGDSIAVAGVKFSKRSTLKLALVGLGGRFALAEVKSDSAGAFDLGVLIPKGAAPGMYRLVAFADDGDEAASLDVVLVPATAVEGENDHHLDVPPSVAPTDQVLVLERATSPLVTWGAYSVIILALGVGVFLIRERNNA